MSVVECENLTKDYKVGITTVHALRGVNITIESGEFTAIAGPSGSGKTTLLNIIGCLDKPTSGKIKLNGIFLEEHTKNELSDIRRDNLGFIFQTFNLIPVLTAYENVSFSLSLKKGVSGKELDRKTRQILADVGLSGMEDRKPSELSGGQQQRVAIARALVKEPSVILADEPTANLDSKTGREVLTLMKELNEKKGITYLFSTHDNMVMEFAKRLILMHDGAVSSDERRK